MTAGDIAKLLYEALNAYKCKFVESINYVGKFAEIDGETTLDGHFDLAVIGFGLLAGFGADGYDPQPIESAPKDGSRILLFGDDRLDGTPEGVFPYDPDWNVGHWNDLEGIWRDDQDGNIQKPTHWSPLPGRPI